jgi:hypothetical protein
MWAAILAMSVSMPAWALDCPNTSEELTSYGPSVGFGTTVGAGNEWTSSCGGGNAPDYSYEFVAPLSGTFTFDTVGSAYNTVLSVVNGVDCATEITCNDDTDGTASSVSVDLDAGERVVVNVDGASTNAGIFELNVSYTPPPTCFSDGDLGLLVGEAILGGTTCGQVNDYGSATCGNGQNSADVAYLWTAPASGEYVFSLEGSSYDTGMTLRDPLNPCGEIACGDDTAGNSYSTITRTFELGEQVLVVIDGYGTGNCGAYDLSIVATAGSTCALDGDLSSVTGTGLVTGNTCGSLNNYTATCASGQDAGDQSFLWTAPYTGTFLFDMSGSSYDTGMTLRAVNEPCTEIVCNDDGGVGTTSATFYSMNAGEQITVVVDGYDTDCGNYTLAITEACPVDADLDNFCDPDLCVGNDASGDADADGTCDDLDDCFGDDDSGDYDFDGVCSDVDFELWSEYPYAGGASIFSARGAPAGMQVYVAAVGGFYTAVDAGSCIPGTSVCGNLPPGGRVFSFGPSNELLKATRRLRFPMNLAYSYVTVQAFYLDGFGGGEASAPVQFYLTP